VGEVLETRYAFREILELQAADVLMPDLARTGGILEMKKIAALADTYYVPIAPHNMMGPVATMASVQLCACVPNFRILEFQLGDVPWRDDLLDKPLPLKDGHLELPTEPGLGIRLNHKEVARYRVN
jgi:galactonate dehydratase